MQFGPIDRVILFGGSQLLVAAARQLRLLGLDTRIYTSPRHAAEKLGDDGRTLADTLTDLGVPFVSTEDINSEPQLRGEITSGTLGIGMGEAWSFSPEIIAQFNGRLLDFMGIPHPRYRGGAHYTWMILSGNRDGACNLQVINEEMVQGEHDSGAILKTRPYQFPASARTPQDFFEAAIPEEIAFIKEFLDEAKAGVDFPLRMPDESRSLFFPRLNTMIHGWIDWSWTGHEIERFIAAFDSPYAGASTRVLGTRVHLKHARIIGDEQPFHPFQSGLITRITGAEGMVVATRSGHLAVGSVRATDGASLARPLRIGDRFLTPADDLQSALTDRATYGSSR